VKPYLKNKLGEVVYACNPCYWEGGGRRIIAWGKNSRPYLKNNNNSSCRDRP
jgi:hypothetical protein